MTDVHGRTSAARGRGWPGAAARRAACAVLGALFAALAWYAAIPGPAMATDGRVPRAQDAQERPAADGRMQRGTILAQPGQVTPEKIERWRRMSPEERDRIRERYRRWKVLPPERRDRLMERTRRWRELPEGDRRFLLQRREMYRNAWPEEKRVIEKFFVRWRQLPPERRRALKLRIAEWRGLPAAERDERMMDWPFYNRLRPDEQRVIRWYLFSEPPPPTSTDGPAPRRPRTDEWRGSQDGGSGESMDGRMPRRPWKAESGREPGWRERPPTRE